MRTGDTISEGGRTWTLGQRIGRGSWGITWEAFDREGHRTYAKVPFRTSDGTADHPIAAEAAEKCTAIVHEQAAALRGSPAWAPRIEAVARGVDGTPALVLSGYHTLASRLDSGMPLREALEVVLRVARTLEKAGRVHGNIRPSNILLDDRGHPYLADPSTESWVALRALVAHSAGREDYAPPEGGPPTARFDTWALCRVLHRVILHGDGQTRHEIPRGGLGKVELAHLRDRALARLEAAGANKRFTSRFADRLCSLLNRGLSGPTTPSPPYRFDSARELADRLSEVVALATPRVDSVGRVLPAPEAKGGVFVGGHPIKFSVSTNCTEGVGVDDVVCGVKLVDVDKPDAGRVRADGLQYTASTHPSGRMRFDFVIPEIPPGRYDVTAAFAIKDSGGAPTVAQGRVEVRPPPGWVPSEPAAEPSKATPIAFPSRPAPMAEPEVMQLEGYEPITEAPPTSPSDNVVSFVPLPIAPGADTDPDEPVEVDVEMDPSTGGALDDSDSEVLAASATTPMGVAIDHDRATEPAYEQIRVAPIFDDLPAPRIARPGAADELPEYEDAPPQVRASNPIERVIDLLKADPYTTFMAAVVIGLIVVLVGIVAAKAFGG